MFLMDLLAIIAIVAGVIAITFLGSAIVAFRRRHLFGGSLGAMAGLLMLSVSALFVTIGIAIQGYRALTREEVAATVHLRPTSPQRFEAIFVFPDGRRAKYELAGDQVYVDAHILKWKPLANLLGLHTAYALDRVGGRYVELADERDSVRTIHSLKQDKLFDMYALRTRYAALGSLLDVEYGSGTFVAANEPTTIEVRVSTTGLMIRPRGP